MKKIYDLSVLNWTVSAFTPHTWRVSLTTKTDNEPIPEIKPVKANVPGSVQLALRNAGVLPDWNLGLKSRDCEWVENRHWMFETTLPDDWQLDRQSTCRLRCDGLDGAGVVLCNRQDIGTFNNTFAPYVFDLAPYIKSADNRLQLIFECPPRWPGQPDDTSQIGEWKSRFNYASDWMPRIVQIGIWDKIRIEASDGFHLEGVRVQTDLSWPSQKGSLKVRGEAQGRFQEHHKVRLILERCADGKVIHAQAYPPQQLNTGIEWDGLGVEPWQINAHGEQNLYFLRVQIVERGRAIDEEVKRIGFKYIEWRALEGAPPEADPWLCVLNGKPTFLQGVNWTPIRANFADVEESDYRHRLELYQQLGCNLLRVSGGAFLEKEIFYDLCDELGILVWQEFPLTASGLENQSLEDEESINVMVQIAGSYIARRAHHPSLLMWSDGNEFRHEINGDTISIGESENNSHSLMQRWRQIVDEQDPTHRFIHTFAGDNSLFRSETGYPGASSASLIHQFADAENAMPGTADNPLWRRFSRWIDWPQFIAEFGREPKDLEEYSAWSQERQKHALVIAARECKKRFPDCGGFLVWMGHDSFPCPVSTSIIDFLGHPKAAALGLGQVFQTTPEDLHKDLS